MHLKLTKNFQTYIEEDLKVWAQMRSRLTYFRISKAEQLGLPQSHTLVKDPLIRLARQTDR